MKHVSGSSWWTYECGPWRIMRFQFGSPLFAMASPPRLQVPHQHLTLRNRLRHEPSFLAQSNGPHCMWANGSWSRPPKLHAASLRKLDSFKEPPKNCQNHHCHSCWKSGMLWAPRETIFLAFYPTCKKAQVQRLNRLHPGIDTFSPARATSGSWWFAPMSVLELFEEHSLDMPWQPFLGCTTLRWQGHQFGSWPCGLSLHPPMTWLVTIKSCRGTSWPPPRMSPRLSKVGCRRFGGWRWVDEV